MEVPSSQAEVPSSQAEVPSSEVEIPSSEAEVPSSEVEIPSSEAEVPSSEAEVPSSELEIPSSEAKVPSSQVEVPSSEAEVPSSQVEVPSSQVEVPSSQVEVPSSQAEIRSNVLVPNTLHQEPNYELRITNYELRIDKVSYRFTFRPIERKFLKPLVTSHGNWEIRKAIILHLSDETGKDSWGEIAPISWFGSETLEQALDFCRQLPQEITEEMILSIPDELSASQFGFESALEGLKTGEAGEKYSTSNSAVLSYSGLLPAGEAALNQWPGLWDKGYRTFKWKIGVEAIAKELQIFHSLIHSLPTTAKLRLDANGGLDYKKAQLWLETCDNLQGNIEFIEQPLPVEQLSQMMALSQCYDTAIALDESVATLKQLTAVYEQGWREIFVIKPAIVGSPSRLRQFCQQYNIDVVFSSVFETGIGRKAALQLAAELSPHNRAVGFGINHFFAEAEQTWLQPL